MARESNDDETIIAYKTILAQIIDIRPSGTRQRLATAIGKHRSFVTQITSPAYATPLPARHLGTIFSVCHFSPAEQERFLQAYHVAHPGKMPDVGASERMRPLSLMVPDFGGEKKNKQFDEAVSEFIVKIGAMASGTD